MANPNTPPGVDRHDKQTIVLPKPMTIPDAINWLNTIHQHDEKVVNLNRSFKALPHAGAYATHLALNEVFGYYEQLPDDYGNPPLQITVNRSLTEKVNVPWGKLRVPGISGPITLNFAVDNGPVFSINGKIKNREAAQMQMCCDKIQSKLNLLYKGQAVAVNLDYLSGQAFSFERHAPRFMDIHGVSKDTVILNDGILEQLECTLFAFMERSAELRANKIPLKRGVLLEGPYGVGKTLTAALTARIAVENGWTYLLVQNPNDLVHALDMAKDYEPCVIFCEDIDRIVGSERTEEVDALLNTIDGVESKTRELILVLTTNHVENIGKAMLRPGRLDSVVSLTTPDIRSISRLITLYAKDNLAPNVNLEETASTMLGFIPATIREVIERAKVLTISRTGSANIKGLITGRDLGVTAVNMRRHLELLSDVPEAPKGGFDLLVNTFADTVARRIKQPTEKAAYEGAHDGVNA